jgi:hypothetical protein
MRSTALGLTIALALAACDAGRTGNSEEKLELNSKPALVTGDRHKGAFAAGDSLSMDAELKPLTKAEVKEVRLDTTHKVIEIAPGVRFTAWTNELIELEELERLGLVQLDDRWITVTPKGRLLVRNICMVFDRYLRGEKETRRYSRTI